MARKKKVKGKKKETSVLSKKQEMQVKLIVVFMAILIFFVLLSNFLISSGRSFEYAGLKFQKENANNVVRYLAGVQAKDDSGKNIFYPLIYLREDPRNLRGIEIEGVIRLKKNAALSADRSFIESCEDSILAATTLSAFLSKVGVDSFGASSNKTEAPLLNRTYANCESSGNYTVVLFSKGEESKIKQEGDCYLLNVADCNVMNVTERFIIGISAHSRGIEV